MNIGKIGLSTSAFGYSMGNTGKNTNRRNPKPWTLEEFIDFAHELGFGGIEIPLIRFVPDLDQERIKNIYSKLTDYQMFSVIDAERALDVNEITTLIPFAKKFDSKIIRIKTSSILGLDRKSLGKPWNEHVENCISVLKSLSTKLRENGVRIAIENHQDLDSNDLLKIIEAVGTDVVGVNFDIGNSFSTCEDPVVFAKKLGSHIINIHLKEYKIFKSNEGFRLARCPIGKGSVDFKTILPLLALNSPNAKMVIELGALEARNIARLDSDFWKEIAPREQSELDTFLQLLEKEEINIADDSWKTPWEKEAPGDVIIKYEREEIAESINYLKTL